MAYLSSASFSIGSMLLGLFGRLRACVDRPDACRICTVGTRLHDARVPRSERLKTKLHTAFPEEFASRILRASKQVAENFRRYMVIRTIAALLQG